jgi:membrane associated rhomboid family serine protease
MITLIAVNFVAFLVTHDLSRFAQTSLKMVARNDYGLLGGLVDREGDIYRIVTYGFLHADFRHIALNMLMLFLLGRRLEARSGWARFTGIYFVSLLGGAAGAMVHHPGAFTVGASGAIYGVMGAAYVVERLSGGDPWNDGLGSIIIISVVLSFMGPNISIGGHLGGLAAGAIAALIMGEGALWARRPGRAALVIGGAAVLFGGLAILAAGTWQNPLLG